MGGGYCCNNNTAKCSAGGDQRSEVCIRVCGIDVSLSRLASRRRPRPRCPRCSVHLRSQQPPDVGRIPASPPSPAYIFAPAAMAKRGLALAAATALALAGRGGAAGGGDLCVLFDSLNISSFHFGRVDFAAERVVDLLALPPSVERVIGGCAAGADDGTFFLPNDAVAYNSLLEAGAHDHRRGRRLLIAASHALACTAAARRSRTPNARRALLEGLEGGGRRG